MGVYGLRTTAYSRDIRSTSCPLIGPLSDQSGVPKIQTYEVIAQRLTATKGFAFLHSASDDTPLGVPHLSVKSTYIGVPP